MRRWMGIIATLIVCMLLAGGPAVAKQSVVVEIFYNGVWNDHTADLDDEPIIINHAAGAQQTGIAPTDGTLRFKNPDGRMNPDNPRGPFFGLIGEKVPMRVKVAGDIRISGRAVKWQPRRSLGGSKYISWVDVIIAGKVREMGQGEPPVRSPLFRSISGIAVGDFVPQDYWPGEDRSGATQIASATSGHPAVVPVGPVTYGQDGPAGAASVLKVDAGFSAAFPVRTYADTGRWAVTWIMKIDSRPTAGTTTLLTVHNNGGPLPTWRFILDTTFPDTIIRWIGYNASDVAQFEVFFLPTVGSDAYYGQWFMHTFGAYNFNGTDLKSTMAVDNGRDVRFHATSGANFTGQIGTLNDFTFTVGSALGAAGMQLGHFGAFVDPAFAPFDPNAAKANGLALHGWTGEPAGDRYLRLCREEGITATLVGTAADTQPMGPQPTDTMLKIFEDVAKTDAGIIYDTRSQEGLTFRTGRSLYNQ